MAELRAEGLEDGARQGRRSRDEEPGPLPDPPGRLVRQLEESDVDRRHAEEERGPELLEEGLGPVVLEALDEAHAAAAREPGADAVAESVHVEERQDGEVAVPGRDPPGLDERARVRGEVRRERELRPWPGRWCRRCRRSPPACPPEACHPEGLRSRRAPRESADPPGLPRLELLHVPHRRPGGHEARELSRRHHGRRLRIAHDVAHLALAVEDVDRDEDRAQPQAGQEEIEELEAVGELDGEAVAGVEAAPGQNAGQPARPRLDLAERQRLDRPPRRARARAPAPPPAPRASSRTGRGEGRGSSAKGSAGRPAGGRG